MKKLLITLFLIIPYFSYSQNWQSVRMNDTTYYTIPAADDYLRVVWIESAVASGQDSVFHFYPSIRLGNTTSNCLDTLGPTWLGKKLIKKMNGDELFFNRWLDTIILKPTAVLNATWVMHTDTSNNEFLATITAVDAMIIDNQLDSIKEITIEVFNNNIPVATHVHYNKKIVLSKDHGFVECLEWYGFPENWNLTQTPINEVFPSSSHLHKKLAKKFNVQKPFAEEISYKYQVGNYWQHYYEHYSGPSAPFYIPFTYYIQDSVTQIHSLNTDSVDYTFEKKSFTKWTRGGFPDSLSRKTETIRDTIKWNRYNAQKLSFAVLPELKRIDNNHSTNHGNYFVKIICDKIQTTVYQPTFGVSSSGLSGCYLKLYPLGNAQTLIKEHWFGFGLMSINEEYLSSITPTNYPYKEELTFAKLDSCQYDTPINFLTLSSNSVLLNDEIKIYPNPANNKLNFALKDNSKIKSAKLFSLQAQQILSCENCNDLSTETIAGGLYILNLKTEKGTVRKKIVIQH